MTWGNVSISMAHSRTERPLVLVVEDEFLIRTHAAEVIRDAGFEVMEASNADDAILLLETGRDIRVVFTVFNAGLDGRPEAGKGGEEPLAAGSHRCHIGAVRISGGGLADRYRIFAEAI